MSKKRRSTWPGPLVNADLDILVRWPEHTVGFAVDQKLVRQLNHLCREHGYGKVPWITEHLRRLWYDNEGEREAIAEAKALHLRLISGELTEEEWAAVVSDE